MNSLFDSGLADLGTSLSGAATGGIGGYVQGLQLKQQMQKQALEELQMQRALKNPHITALAHGAYLVQNPETGEIKFNQSPGNYPGGIESELFRRILEHPEHAGLRAFMGYKYGHSPELMQEKVNTEAQRGANQGSQADLHTVQAEQFPLSAEEKRSLIAARANESRARTGLTESKVDTEGARQSKLIADATRTEAITQPDVKLREKAAQYNVARADRLRAQIENDAQLTPARKSLIEARIKAAEAAAAKHREAAKSGGRATENTVTIGVDALGRSYMKPTFKKPEDSKAFMNTYQQWTQPLKNLDIGMLDFESKAKKLSTIRKTWIEKNHPNEAEIAGFDQAMREAQ